jgi:hypothetical protein
MYIADFRGQKSPRVRALSKSRDWEVFPFHRHVRVEPGPTHLNV